MNFAVKILEVDIGVKFDREAGRYRFDFSGYNRTTSRGATKPVRRVGTVRKRGVDLTVSNKKEHQGTLRCKRHPNYQGLRAPTCAGHKDCSCWRVYKKIQAELTRA